MLVDKIIHKFNKILADGTIFQSSWSMEENHKLNMKKNNYETVIHNAPDTNLFNKSNRINFEKKRKIRLISHSWSTNWNKGFKIYQYLDKNLDFSKYEMTFIGNSPIKFKNINWIRPLKSEELVEQLKQQDIFISAAQNESCSNALIEALACGLPAIVINSGSNAELVNDKDLIFNNEQEIIEKLEKVVQNYEFFQKSISLMSLEEVGKKYYDFCKLIYEEFKNKEYFPKKIGLLKFLNLKYQIFRWKMQSIEPLNYFFYLNKNRINYMVDFVKNHYFLYIICKFTLNFLRRFRKKI